MQTSLRPATALVSTSLCLLVISLAFINYYGQIYQSSPLLNTNMKFWTLDQNTNFTVPYLWQVDVIQRPSDNVSVVRAEVSSRSAVALTVYRGNENGSSVWTTIHVRQDLHGLSLDAVFNSTISLWLYPTFTYFYDQQSKSPENAFGIEINDGVNLVWYVFADEPSQSFQLPHHRIVLMQTPLNTWSYRSISIAHEYAEAGWKKPESLSFILILGTTKIHPGRWIGYFSGLNVEINSLLSQTLTTSSIEALVAVDVLIISGLASVTVLLKRRER